MKRGSSDPDREARLAKAWTEISEDGLLQQEEFCREHDVSRSWLQRALRKMRNMDRAVLSAEGVRVVGEGWGV